MSTKLVDYFLGRLSGRFGSSTAGALGAGVAGGASPKAGGVLLKSLAAGATVGTGAGVGAAGWAHVCSVV